MILASGQKGKCGELYCMSYEWTQVLYLLLTKSPTSMVPRDLGAKNNLLCMSGF